MKNKMIIHLEGGLVQGIYTKENIDVLIVTTDRDIEEDELSKPDAVQEFLQGDEVTWNYDYESIALRELDI